MQDHTEGAESFGVGPTVDDHFKAMISEVETRLETARNAFEVSIQADFQKLGNLKLLHQHLPGEVLGWPRSDWLKLFG